MSNAALLTYAIVALVLWVGNHIGQATSYPVGGEPTPPIIIALTWPLWATVAAVWLLFVGVCLLFRFILGWRPRP